MTEEAMLQGCIKNDASAQQELYHHYSPKMLSVCYRMQKTGRTQKICCRKALLKFFMQIRQFQNRGALEGWIRKIMVHTCINSLKKK